MPALAQAATPSPLAGARLSSLSYSLEIKASHCPAGISNTADPSCEHTTLTSSLKTVGIPKVRRIAGQVKFPAGLRVTGRGAADCTVESASAASQDGQILGSALRVTHTQVVHTDLLVATGRRSARWAWPEPLAPAMPCDNGEAVIPQTQLGALPRIVISPRLPMSTLEQRRFGTTIRAVGVKYDVTKPDGSHEFGEARWRLDLTYRRYARK